MACGNFDTIKELPPEIPSSKRSKSLEREKQIWISPPQTISKPAEVKECTHGYVNALEAPEVEEARLMLPDTELSRVFGGGLMMGSVTLLSVSI